MESALPVCVSWCSCCFCLVLCRGKDRLLSHPRERACKPFRESVSDTLIPPALLEVGKSEINSSTLLQGTRPKCEEHLEKTLCTHFHSKQGVLFSLPPSCTHFPLLSWKVPNERRDIRSDSLMSPVRFGPRYLTRNGGKMKEKNVNKKALYLAPRSSTRLYYTCLKVPLPFFRGCTLQCRQRGKNVVSFFLQPLKFSFWSDMD